MALSVLSVLLGLAPFYCMYRMICLFAAGTAAVGGVVKWCAAALAAYAVKILLFSLSTGVSHSMAFTVPEGLRLRLADRFLHAPPGDVEGHSIGEIKNMMVDKIESIEPPLAHLIPEGAGRIVLPIVSIAALLCLDWRLALASLVTFPLSLVSMGLTFKINGDSFVKYDRSAGEMNSAIVEYIEGIEVIKAFGRAGVSYEKYAGAITSFRTFVIKWLTGTFVTMKLSFALFPSTLIGTLPTALALASGGAISGPQAALAVMLSVSMVGSLAKLEIFSENMRQVKSTVEGLEAFLEMPELPEPARRAKVTRTDVALRNVRFSYTGDRKDEVLHGESFIDADGRDIRLEHYDIAFRHVDFGYDSRPVLKDVSFTIPERTSAAIVGPSGSGKTTVCSLIARFYDPQNGSITVGGHDLREFTCDSLLTNISMVFQNVYLFHDTVRANILFGRPDATEAEMIEAAKKARCHDFIMALPDGYDTVVGEGGGTLSGGEKQRISIARAILKDAPIIILDEATASIDPENEHLIQQALSELTRGKTIITIAHRLATVQNADQILVVDDGRIVEVGTHEELLRRNGLYKRFTDICERAEGWHIAAG